MKIKLEDYSLISNEWIDEEIKKYEDNLEAAKKFGKFELDRLSISALGVLHKLKQQLITSDKLAEKCFDAGRIPKTKRVEGYGGKKRIEIFIDKQDFITSEIEIL